MFNTKKGTTLYLAVIVLSVLLTISIGLSLIIFGQIKIQREIGLSVVALCAAESGIERALYAIYKENILQPDTATSITSTLDNGSSYIVYIYASSTGQCDSSTQYYCLKSRGNFRGVVRAIEVSF